MQKMLKSICYVFVLFFFFQNTQSSAPSAHIVKLLVGGGGSGFVLYQLYKNRPLTREEVLLNDLREKNKETFNKMCKHYPALIFVNSNDLLGVHSGKSPCVTSANLRSLAECLDRKKRYHLNEDSTTNAEDVKTCIKSTMSRFD
jgi:hypothetical protein